MNAPEASDVSMKKICLNASKWSTDKYEKRVFYPNMTFKQRVLRWRDDIFLYPEVHALKVYENFYLKLLSPNSNFYHIS